MVTLITEHGSFSAENESAAIKLSRKAQRDAKRGEAQRKVDWERANELAQINAYRVYDRLRRGALVNYEVIPRGDNYGCPAEHDYNTGLVTYCIHTGTTPAGKPGRIIMTSRYEYIDTVVRDTAGWIACVVVHDVETGTDTVSAVGVHNEQVALVNLHGITAQDFGRNESAAS